MVGIKNLQSVLMVIYENWITILVCIGLIVGIVKKTIGFFSQSKEKQYEIAKENIRHTILEMIYDAEIDLSDWSGAGQIKRSEVIARVFSEYPILNKITNQEEVINYIDEQIKDSLKVLRKIIEENNNNKDSE